MRREDLVNKKTISVFDMSKLTIGNAYLYTHITDKGNSITFQGVLLQKYEDYLVFAISNHSAFISYSTFVDDTAEGGSIVRLPARFLNENDTLNEMTLRKQGKWKKWGKWEEGEGYAICTCCPAVYSREIFQTLTAFDDKAPRYCSYCGAELWRETDETDNTQEVNDVKAG